VAQIGSGLPLAAPPALLGGVGAMASELFHRRNANAFAALSAAEAEELSDAMLAVHMQTALLGDSSDSDGGSESDDDESDSDSSADGGSRLPWALRNVPVLVSWTSLAAVFALQPPGRRIPPTLDLAITTVRGDACLGGAERSVACLGLVPSLCRLTLVRAPLAQAAFALEYNLLVFPLLAQLLSGLLRCAPCHAQRTSRVLLRRVASPARSRAALHASRRACACVAPRCARAVAKLAAQLGLTRALHLAGRALVSMVRLFALARACSALTPHPAAATHVARGRGERGARHHPRAPSALRHARSHHVRLLFVAVCSDLF